VAEQMGLAELAMVASVCTECALSEHRTQVVFGSGDPDADLMFVGEAPGAAEDVQGAPFVGRSGRLLDTLIAEVLGIERHRCYIANVVKCRPPDNRNPKAAEIAACQPFLTSQIELVGPRVVVTLGSVATTALLGTHRGVTEARGRSYPFGGARLVPTFHPAAGLRSGQAVVDQMRIDLGLAGQLLGWS
jgi:uracil-DNA glycosylase